MKLMLDHTQRLNLHALLGAQRADVGTIRAIWAVQDKITLNASEQETIEFKHEIVNGTERIVWNPALSIPPQMFEFSDTETARVKAAIETWHQYTAGMDRRWLQPLINAVFPPEPTG